MVRSKGWEAGEGMADVVPWMFQCFGVANNKEC